MRFALDASGAQAAGSGIGNLFKAYAMGEFTRQQAEANSALRSAQTYSANMSGNKSGAEAEGLGLTNQARRDGPPTGLPDYLANAYRLFQATGDTNMERFANAGTAIQTQGIRDQAVQSVDDLDRMNRLSTLTKPGGTYTPFSNVGSTGYSIDGATGAQIEGSPVLARLFGDKTGSEIMENRAQAGASGASARNSNASADLTLRRLGILNDTGSLPGTAGGGEDATNAKARNAIIAAVEREMPGAGDAEIMAEVNTRLARRGIGSENKNPPPAPGRPKMPLPQGVTPELAIQQARAAIAAGKDRNAVIQRLREMGVDPKGL